MKVSNKPNISSKLNTSPHDGPQRQLSLINGLEVLLGTRRVEKPKQSRDVKPPFLSRNSQFREEAEVKKENISIRGCT